ncbi:hypothetical protein BDN70DRAFT_877697 [Pholiota conissans]|uniref:Uncharacterized protein n=1 Tax=Pholiota conissans TaxID=109636 RepID=A0A9P5Z2P3_9AGAR|nr:hypothetical protein BDN70DRAFT_877697 [Pholiota conissans]
MRFPAASLTLCITLISQALASPAPQVTDPVVHHCGGTLELQCPKGWRCCGPIEVTLGGTCYKGLTGVCPL